MAIRLSAITALILITKKEILDPPCNPTYVPAKMWCYTRLAYMAMSYLYGKQFFGPITPVILQLRDELYAQPNDEIKWRSFEKENENHKQDKSLEEINDESEGWECVVVIDELYEQLSVYMTTLKDDGLAKEDSRITKEISFLYPT
ncbi:beta-amyrin synthase, partial [Tanacetum coccineum]